MKATFRFYKAADDRWFIDLPGWNGSAEDLEMVQGADTMLDKVSSHAEECLLEMADEPFEGADVLRLLTDLRGSVGGGEYYLETYDQKVVNHELWLCEVTEFVFGCLPREIYFKKTMAGLNQASWR